MTQNKSTKRLEYGLRNLPIPEWGDIVQKSHKYLDLDSKGPGRDIAIIVLSLDIELDKLRKGEER
jgi:hypothetical protein